jgi:hypothetical protein
MQDKQVRWFLREPPVCRCHRETTLNKSVDPTQEPIEDLQEELRWEDLFKRTQPQLSAAAQRAKQQIAAGMATPMDYDRL